MDDQTSPTPQPPAPQVPAPPPQPWEVRPTPPTPKDAKVLPQVIELAARCPGAVLEAVEMAGQITAVIGLDQILAVCHVCKQALGYAYLVDLTAVDWPARGGARFDVVYWLHRHTDSLRLRLKVRVPEGTEVPSVTAVWKTANWMEREVFDMFGIYFKDHPNLERILTWEGFNGHPLRKDFPIEGIDTGAAIYPDIYPPGGGPSKVAGEEDDHD